MSAVLGLTGLFCTKSLGKKDVRCLKELTLAVDKGGGRSEARRSGIGAEPVRKKGSRFRIGCGQQLWMLMREQDAVASGGWLAVLSNNGRLATWKSKFQRTFRGVSHLLLVFGPQRLTGDPLCPFLPPSGLCHLM